MIFSLTIFSICDAALNFICSRHITKLFDTVTELNNQTYFPVGLLFL